MKPDKCWAKGVYSLPPCILWLRYAKTTSKSFIYVSPTIYYHDLCIIDNRKFMFTFPNTGNNHYKRVDRSTFWWCHLSLLLLPLIILRSLFSEVTPYPLDLGSNAIAYRLLEILLTNHDRLEDIIVSHESFSMDIIHQWHLDLHFNTSFPKRESLQGEDHYEVLKLVDPPTISSSVRKNEITSEFS